MGMIMFLSEMAVGTFSGTRLENMLPLRYQAIRAVYPDWAIRRLTPSLEKGRSTGVLNPHLFLHEKQMSGDDIAGKDIYSWLLPDQEHYRVQPSDPINQCIELADLQFCVQYPKCIPSEWYLQLVYAWKSVVLGVNGKHYAPFIFCNGRVAFVFWYGIDSVWTENEPACLSKNRSFLSRFFDRL